MPSPIRADRLALPPPHPEPGPVRALGLTLLDLVVPQECAGCGAGGLVWCGSCQRAALAAARVHLPGSTPGVAWAPHADGLGRAVVAFKDGGQRRLAAPLGRFLAGAVREALLAHQPGPGQSGARQPGTRKSSAGQSGPEQPVWLVPVPSRPAARRRRGLDHTAVLAGRAARELRRSGLPAHRVRALRQVGAPRDQVGLDRQGRARNMAGTMRAGPIPPGIVVLVDDVTTTGATLAEAARAIRDSASARTGSRAVRGPVTSQARLVLAATVTAAQHRLAGA